MKQDSLLHQAGTQQRILITQNSLHKLASMHTEYGKSVTGDSGTWKDSTAKMINETITRSTLFK